MNRNAIKAYQRAQKLGLSERQAEAMAFDKAATILDAANHEGVDVDTYREALQFNQLLWTIVQAEMIKNDIPPADTLEANLLDLSVFVDKQTFLALEKRDAEVLETLAQIDMNIANGLAFWDPGRLGGGHDAERGRRQQQGAEAHQQPAAELPGGVAGREVHDQAGAAVGRDPKSHHRGASAAPDSAA